MTGQAMAQPPEVSRPQGTLGQRLPSLTSMRTLAGLTVFITHGLALAIFASPIAMMNYVHFGANAGNFGLAFFFVLTGFVVTWTATPDDTARRFWRRRFFKIFPNHIVVSVILLVLWIIAGLPFQVLPVVTGLFLVNSWIPLESYNLGVLNGPMWSANIDVLAYAAFPLLYFLVKKIRPRHLWYWAVGCVLVVVLVPWFTNSFLPSAPADLVVPGVSWPRHWFAFYFPLTRAVEFVVGIIMARIVLTGRWVRIGVLPTVLLTIAVYLATLDIPIFFGYTFIPLVPIALLIPAIAVSDLNGRETILTSKPMVWLGDRMYAFFVVHINVILLIGGLLSGQWGLQGRFMRHQFGTGTGILLLILIYLVCLLVSSVLYALVERPMMRRFARPKGDRPVGASGTRPVDQPLTSGDQASTSTDRRMSSMQQPVPALESSGSAPEPSVPPWQPDPDNAPPKPQWKAGPATPWA
jgi:peptidoglycan/LPS O-acetylase OafA/YrhL